MKTRAVWTLIVLMGLLLMGLGCDKDDPVSPKDQRPDFENSEGYNISFYTSTVSAVPEGFSRYSEPTTVPTTINAVLWSAQDTSGLVGDGSVVLDGTYELTPDGSFEFLDVVFEPVFQTEIDELFQPGSEHTLAIDSPTWGQYTFDLTVPEEIELLPYDITDLHPGDRLFISWEAPSDSSFYAILHGDSLTWVDEPIYGHYITYWPDTTIVVGMMSGTREDAVGAMDNSITTALYQELTFEW
ncbi:hypothetical protein KQI63_08125 [bacterium]|nr:hypothetical protein [bacterium]